MKTTRATRAVDGWLIQLERDALNEHWANWEIFAIVCVAKGGGYLFERKGSTGPIDNPTDDTRDAVPALTGHVKWDGCLELSAAEPVHLCGKQAGEEFGRALAAVWDLASTVLPAWDHDLAGTL